MTDNKENQEKRERTKTVMLGPDITKEIRAQLEEQKLSAIFEENLSLNKSQKSDIDTIPANFFYNIEQNKEENPNQESKEESNSEKTQDDYSIFGGENPINEIQEERFETTEVLTNNSGNTEHQTNEVQRAKKETEEIASKILKELILDSPKNESGVKDSLIKEIENEDEIFKKFEYEKDENNVDNSNIEVDNNLKEVIEPLNEHDVFTARRQSENDSDKNVFKATQLNLEKNFDMNQDGIFWNEKTPIVGFLVSFNRDTNGEYYELREGKLTITSRMNKNINSLVINDESISVMHAIMKISYDKITLLDQFSENGTTVKHKDSDSIIELSGESEKICDKDIITFGNVTFKVCLI